MKEDVSDFDISMDHMILSQIFKSFEDVQNVRLGSTFSEEVFSSQFAFEVSSITDLCHNITVSITGENLVTPENVGMAEFFENINLGKKEFFQLLRFKGVQLYHLNCNSLI